MKKLVWNVGIFVLMGALMTPVSLTGQNPVDPGATETYEVGRALPPLISPTSLSAFTAPI